MNKVLVIGRGGREHALAWKFSKSASVGTVYVAPGNKGMADVAVPVNIEENDFNALIDFAKKEAVALTVIGPEIPLVNGIVDRFLQAGLPVFGPTKNAALIEGSKSFAKNLMKKHGIPTAAYEVFTDYAAACRHVEKADMPIVIKADGLAAGKGVVIAHTPKEAQHVLQGMMQDGERHGESSNAGMTVVLEEFLEGEEFSYIAFVSGEKVYPLALSQDHKRAFDGDKGPNTGGMGAYSPVPQIGNDVVKCATETILEKTAQVMARENRSFTGFLYAGLIATSQGPKVIEFNARLGDPEAQVLLPRLESDLFETIMSLLKGDDVALSWSADAAVGVVLASKGYPRSYRAGFPIDGLDSLKDDTFVFHSGTDLKDGKLVTNGGRVLVVARKAQTFDSARKEVYEEIAKIKCDNLFCRNDIGWRGTSAEA